MKPQTAKVVSLLKKNSLTAAMARSRYGIQNLRARICEARDVGFDINSTPKSRGPGVRYVLNW